MKKILISSFLVLGTVLFTRASADDTPKKMNLSAFEENKGQITGLDASKVKYAFKDGGLNVFLTPIALVYQFEKIHISGTKMRSSKKIEPTEKLEEVQIETYRMDVELVGSNPNPSITNDEKSLDYVHYYNQNTFNVHSYKKITYHNVYPNIDWVIYTSNNQIKYDFVVHPGGNPDQIQLKTKWVEHLDIQTDGSLCLKNRMGSITEQAPMSFQNNKKINTKFILTHDNISFSLENYDPSKTLIIDPSLQWSTYYGGGDDDYGSSTEVDASGNVYLTGSTWSTWNIASGGYQMTKSGNQDAFLVKFNASGTRIWGTYYGGTDEDYGFDCTIDDLGNVYMAGRTKSTTNIASNGFQNTYGGGLTDGYIVKFNNSGTRLWSSYYGGNDADHIGSLDNDGFGNIYAYGRTHSTNLTMSAHQSTYGGGSYDGFLIKVNSSGTLDWGTYYGGSASDETGDCVVDNLGNIYISGFTSSTNAIATPSAHQNTHGAGTEDGFLAKFNSAGVRLWATYYGGTAQDWAYACAVDASNNVYISGRTASNNGIAQGGHLNTINPGYMHAFLAKFNENGVRQWGTYYGSTNGDTEGYACIVDALNYVYICGYTKGQNGIAFGGHQNTYGGGSGDGFLVKLDDSGVRQWGTYFGGSSDESCGDLCTDQSGFVYMAGLTRSTNQISYLGHQNTYGGSGNYDGFLAKFEGSFICTATSSSFTASFCQGTTYSFNGQTLSSAGVYKDTLVNVAGCDSVITLTLTETPSVAPSITISQNPNSSICAGDQVVFTATSSNQGNSPSYQWKKNGNNVGTGLTTYTTSTLADGNQISCMLNSNAICASPATTTSNTLIITVHPLPTVTITQNGSNLDATGGLTTYQWLLNGNSISGALSPQYTPTQNGDYQVLAVDSNGCEATSVIYNWTSVAIENHTLLSTTPMIYPNPTQDILNVESKEEIQSLKIYYISGQLIQEITKPSSVINISHLPVGMYFVEMNAVKGKRYIQQIVKE